MRVVIAEDSVLLREGLARLLIAHDIDVVATVADADQLLRAAADLRPDLAVVDVRMPPTNTDEGVRAALALRELWPDLAIVLLSQYIEEQSATELLSGRIDGLGYLLKDRVADVAEFVEALHRVAAGGTALDPEVVARLMARHRSDPLLSLTPRETDVLRLMAQGRSNAAIATGLNISGHSVEKYTNGIFAKLALAPAGTDHRRVLAVLHFLRSESV